MKARGETLHPGQVKVAKDLFLNNKRVIMSQWGRSGGKSYLVCYIAWVYAQLNPGAQILIVCPQRKQGKDIYWASGRMPRFGPGDWLEAAKDSEIRLVFKNGSVVTIDGCENYPALRGLKPNLVIYDEFQDHSREFHLQVMAPNLTAKKASLLVFGTPPATDCYYVEFYKQLMTEIEEGDSTRVYYEFPSEINPTLDREELEKVKVRLCRAGDEKIWLREYMGQLIFGGEGAVFSHFSKAKHVRSHKVIMSALEKDKKSLKWFSVFDPGSTTCFAVLFAAYNPYTSQLFLLDEIYETNWRNTDAVGIFKRTIEKEKELYPNRPPKTFKRIYDEAATWFYINTNKWFRGDPEYHMTPCEKNKVKGWSSKEQDCSLIKQIVAAENVLHVSDRCRKFAWEVENYVLDEDGDYPKDHDHLIDCLTYLLKACNYKFIDDVPVHEVLDTYSRQNNTPAKKIETLKDITEWADNVEDASLHVYSIWDDYGY